MAHVPMIRSALLASLHLANKVFTDSRKPATKYLMPRSTLICDSMTRTAVADEKALITGIDMNSNIKPS